MMESRLQQDRVKVVSVGNGEGMSQANLDILYESLCDTENFQIGVVLPMAREIMGQHSGGIEFDSQVGIRTAVALRLPTKIGN